MPIPLLKFPLLVLDEVIKNIGIRELFSLSLCSKKMHQVAKNLRDKSMEFELHLEGSKTVDIHLCEKGKLDPLFGWTISAMQEYQLEGWSVDRYRGVVFQENQFGFISYWEDVDDGTRSLAKHISDLFGVQINVVVLSNGLLLWTLDWVEQRQGPKSYQVFIRNFGIADEQFRHLMVDLNPSHLRLTLVPSAQFRIESLHKTYDDLTLRRGDWITAENLLTLDCSRLQLWDKTFTVAEINRFLRHLFIDGGAPRLVDFWARVENGVDEENGILEGIREVLAPIPEEQQFDRDLNFWQLKGSLNRGENSLMVLIFCSRFGSAFELRLT